MKLARIRHGTADTGTPGMLIAHGRSYDGDPPPFLRRPPTPRLRPACRAQRCPPRRQGSRRGMRHRLLHPRDGRGGRFRRHRRGSGSLPGGHRPRAPCHPNGQLHLFGGDRRSPRRGGWLVRRRSEQPDDPSPTRNAASPGDPRDVPRAPRWRTTRSICSDRWFARRASSGYEAAMSAPGFGTRRP